MNTNRFRLTRVLQLIRSDLYLNAGAYLLLFAALMLAALIFGSSLLNTCSEAAHDIERDKTLSYSTHFSLFFFFPISLLLFGTIFTSMVYRELNQKNTRQFYLGLPALNIEKWVSKWILSAILFPIVFFLFYQLFAQSLLGIVDRIGYKLIRPKLFDGFVWNCFLTYFILQSLFFWAAISLKRFSYLKLLLGGLLFFLLSSAIYQATLVFLSPEIEKMGSHWWGLLSTSDFFYNNNVQVKSNFLLQTPENLTRYKLIGLVLSMVFLMISFFKLKEQEI
ncbi:MAG: hypothetical protein AAF806_31145 [Bacteroidota bacterium]